MKKLILGISIMAIGAVGTISMIVATILSPLNPWSYDGISGWYGCILGMDLLIPFIISIIVAIIGLAIASLLVVYSSTGSLAYRENGGNTSAYLIKQTFLLFLCFVVLICLQSVHYKYFLGAASALLLISFVCFLSHGHFTRNVSRTSISRPKASNFSSLVCINCIFSRANVDIFHESFVFLQRFLLN